MPSRVQKQKACIPCAEAKRRCDKGLPECQRCLDRDVDCRYPQPKRRLKGPRRSVPDGGGSAVFPEAYLDFGIVDNEANHETGESSLVYPADGEHQAMPDSMVAMAMPSISFNNQDGVFAIPNMEDTFAPIGSTRNVSESITACCNSPFTITTTTSSTSPSAATETLPWFLQPSSWTLHHTNHDPGCVSDIQLEPSIKKVEHMLQDWLHHGHNAFIHRKLYIDTGLPECLQDAYTILSAYTHKTPAVNEMVTQIAEGKMSALAASDTQLQSTSNSTQNPTHDVLTKLARVQALFIYIFIHVFDGSVRQRSRAEKHLPILRSWVKEMYNTAKDYQGPDASAARLGTTTGTTTLQPRVIWHFDPATMSAEQEDDTLTQLWKAWILTESVRRTYTVVETVTNVYEIMTKGAAECQGGVSFTGRRGAWDAGTAVSWNRVVRDGLGNENGKADREEEAEVYVADGLQGEKEKVPLLVEALQPESVMARCSARDVDEFAIMCWSFIVGEDKVRSWIDRCDGR